MSKLMIKAAKRPRFDVDPKQATTPSNDRPTSLPEFVGGAAMVRSQAGDRPPKPIRLNLDLDPQIHDRLKRRALDLKITVATLVRQLIDVELSR